MTPLSSIPTVGRDGFRVHEALGRVSVQGPYTCLHLAWVPRTRGALDRDLLPLSSLDPPLTVGTPFSFI